MSRRRQLVYESAVVAAILGGLAYLLWPAIRSGPAGRAIPIERPDEARRIHHPAGFSIVAPVDWEQTGTPLRRDDPRLHLHPKSPLPSRSSAGLVVSYVGMEPPRDLDGFRKTAFQGQPAYERMKIVRKWTFDDPALSEYTMYVQTDEGWFQIAYFIAEARTELPSTVREYVRTIRWD